jgi:hypothetical protein
MSQAIATLRRAHLEEWIETAIALLDQIDGDPDIEGQDTAFGSVDPDLEGDTADDEPTLGSCDRQPQTRWSAGLYDEREEDDPPEEDDPGEADDNGIADLDGAAEQHGYRYVFYAVE